MNLMGKSISAFLLFLVSLIYQSKGQNDAFKKSGFIDLNYYYDTRNETDGTINLLLKTSSQLSYFGFVNFIGNQNELSTNSFYSEHNLRYGVTPSNQIQITIQHIMRNGESNDASRLGIRWSLFKHPAFKDSKLAKLVFYSINPFIVEFGSQFEASYFTAIEHVYKITLIPNKLYIGGFGDQNFIPKKGVKANWVTEHQLGYRVYDDFHLIAEFRLNQYLEQEMGVGMGFQYKTTF